MNDYIKSNIIKYSFPCSVKYLFKYGRVCNYYRLSLTRVLLLEYDQMNIYCVMSNISINYSNTFTCYVVLFHNVTLKSNSLIFPLAYI